MHPEPNALPAPLILFWSPSTTCIGAVGLFSDFPDTTGGLIEPIYLIFNQSIQTGVFPDQLKIARILPLFKKTDKTIVSNYRPISLLNSISKLFEAIMADRLTSFFNKFNLFYKFQFDFRKNHSTKFALLSSLDDIFESLANRRHVAAIFFDNSKAFDTIDRSILLSKLYHYGIRGNILNWFQSYLSFRSQFVELNGVKSPLCDINYGVPQGSVLGPLLFLIYVNDIGNIPNLPSQPKIFADDTNLFLNAENLPNLNVISQNATDSLSEWMILNKLTIYREKTVYMLFNTFY